MKYALMLAALFIFVTACAQAPQPAQPPVQQQPPSQYTPEPQPPVLHPQGSEATSPLKEFTVEMKQFSFSPSTITVKNGDKVRLALTSRDVSHGFMIQELGVSSGPVAKGQTKTIEFTADKVGTFEFRCSVVCGVGHKDMKGTLIVQA